MIDRLIGSLNEGRGQALLRVSSVLTSILILFYAYAQSQFTGLCDRDAMENAHLGRRLAEGRGFSTLCLRLPDLAGVRLDAVSGLPEGRPDVRHAPGYPAVVSGLFRAFRPSYTPSYAGDGVPAERQVLIPLGLFLVAATAGLLFGLGRVLFGMPTAVLSAGVFLTTESVLSSGCSGRAEPLSAFLFTLAALFLVLAFRKDNRERGGSSAGWRWLPGVVLAGLAACGSLLTQYPLGIGVLALMGFAWLAAAERRWLVVIILGVVVVLAVSPWVLRNQSVSRSNWGQAPLALLPTLDTSGVAVIDLTPEARGPLIRLVRQAERNVFRLPRVVRHTLSEHGLVLVGSFFIVSLFHLFRAANANRLRWALTAALLLELLRVAVTGQDTSPQVLAYVPLMILFAMAFLVEKVEGLGEWDPALPSLATAGFLLMNLVPLASTVLVSRAPAAYPPYLPPLVRHVAGEVADGELVGTDIPWAVAWYANRAALQLPRSPGTLVELARDVPVGGLYLADPERLARAWKPLVNGSCPTNFPWADAVYLPPGTRDQLFLFSRPSREEQQPSAGSPPGLP